MYTFLKSNQFDAWLESLRDRMAKARIVKRIRLAELGNFGDCKPVGSGVFEMRIHTGAGYRVYYTRRDEIVYLLLIGGDKSTQQQDINQAITMMKQIKDKNHD